MVSRLNDQMASDISVPEGVGGESSFTLSVKCGFLAGNSPKLGTRGDFAGRGQEELLSGKR